MADTGVGLSKEVYCEPPDLIEAIQNKPELWDKNNGDFKIKKARDQAWIEIASATTAGFEEKNLDEKTLVVKSLQEKWRNIKDAFFRTLKKKTSYIYQKELQFLEALYHENESSKEPKESVAGTCEVCKCPKISEGNSSTTSASTSSPIKKRHSRRRHKREQDSDSDYEETGKVTVEPSPTTHNYPTRKRKAHEAFPNGADADAAEIDADKKKTGLSFSISSFFSERDEDELFFASILSSVRKMPSEKKIQFRMGVLGLIQEILIK